MTFVEQVARLRWLVRHEWRRVSAMAHHERLNYRDETRRRLEARDRRCAECVTRYGSAYKPFADDQLVVDHCHYSGIVRGLLCRSCNVLEGHGSMLPTWWLDENGPRVYVHLWGHVERRDPSSSQRVLRRLRPATLALEGFLFGARS